MFKNSTDLAIFLMYSISEGQILYVEVNEITKKTSYKNISICSDVSCPSIFLPNLKNFTLTK